MVFHYQAFALKEFLSTEIDKVIRENDRIILLLRRETMSRQIAVIA